MNIRGERIKCVSNLHAPELVVGKVYTAGETRTNTYGIWQVEVGGKWYAHNRFELAKEKEVMEQQFYIGDVVEVVEAEEEENWYKIGDKFVVSGWNDGEGALSSEPPHVTIEGEVKYAWVMAKNLKILSRAWQKNTGEQPVEDDVEVEVKLRCAVEDKCLAGESHWNFEDCTGDIVEWRLADSVSSVEDQPEDSSPHVAVGDELVATTTLPAQEWTDKHYENNYTLTQKDIERGFVKIDPYFVSKIWKIGSKDDSGALWHCFKTIARFGEKNSREREIKALYAQIKCLAEIEGVELE